MKITDVKAVYPRYQHLAPSWRTHFWQIVVRVDTDTGVTGYGYGGGGVAGVAVVNGHLRDLLIGREIESVADIQATYDVLYMESLPYGRKGLGVMALSGIDLALYDLLGKARDLPVCALLTDAPKQGIRAYATGEDAELYRDLGYTANKFGHRWTGSAADYDTAVRSATMPWSWSMCTCPGTLRLRSKWQGVLRTTTSTGLRTSSPPTTSTGRPRSSKM